MKAYKFFSVVVVLLFTALYLRPERAQSFAVSNGDARLPINQLIIKYEHAEQVALEGPSQTNEMTRLSSVAGVGLSYACRTPPAMWGRGGRLSNT